ncbi:MAG: hypothetical protein Q4D02_06490 [Clostridia bacterium]|nr:hypothetical protein [Clostridia bacterium]
MKNGKIFLAVTLAIAFVAGIIVTMFRMLFYMIGVVERVAVTAGRCYDSDFHRGDEE